MAWLNFSHAQSNSKNGLKAKKIKLPQMKKQQMKFSCTYLPLCRICRISKKFLKPMCHFLAQNGPFVLNNFLGTKHYYYFHLPIGPFQCANLKKILAADPQLWEFPIFFGPKWFIFPKQIFFWKIINIILIYLLASFIVQNLKQILPADPEL